MNTSFALTQTYKNLESSLLDAGIYIEKYLLFTFFTPVNPEYLDAGLAAAEVADVANDLLNDLNSVPPNVEVTWVGASVSDCSVIQARISNDSPTRACSFPGAYQ